RVGVGDHRDAPRRAPRRGREGAALTHGPERARGDDEGGDVATAPAAAPPDRAQQRREPSKIPVGAHHGRRDGPLASRGGDADPRRTDVHAYAEGSPGSPRRQSGIPSYEVSCIDRVGWGLLDSWRW